jgi:hypothetical protein
MTNYPQKLDENNDGGGLTIFDIDDTLFHTTAKIAVMKDGNKLRDLTNQEFNTYKLKNGESFDFGQFRDAKKFREESKPITKMFAKAKAILGNVSNKPKSRVIILTARDDFDDREVFLNTFRDHGFDIDKVRVERAGKIKGMQPEHSKFIIIRNYLKQGTFARVRLFDDSRANLNQFLRLQQEFPNISFEAYFVDHDGNAKKINTTVKTSMRFHEFTEATYVGNLGVMELVKFNQKASQKQKDMLQSHIKNKQHDKMKNLIADVTGVKLHKSMHEEIKPDILPKAGAGQDGTDELVKTYMKDTPGQNFKKFKDYIK